LDVSVGDISSFKREHELAPAESGDGGSDFYEEEELDLRAEDDALVAAELAAEADDDEEEADDESADDQSGGDEDDEGGEQPRRRRRGRRGGRGRRRGGRPAALEGTFDHGEEGYGLWLDPSIQDDPVYAEHWAGHRPVTVSVEPDRIVITRTDGDSADE
jgi:hypothetical protein